MTLGGAPTAAPAGIDEYRLVRMLGRGGMGTVFLAHDTILDRAVALKLVRIGTTEESWLRFLTEARAIARLDHPNVIAIFRAGTSSSGEPYLVQELVRGQSLDRVVLPLAAGRCLELATGIARGLAAAHRRGVLHRDVKPSNIMIDEAGTPRLLDFGLAKLIGAPPGEPPPADRPSAAAVPAGSTSAASPVTATASVSGMLAVRSPTPGNEVAATAELPATAAGDDVGAALASTASSPGDGVAGHTDAGAILGTPRYMAPEVWRGEVATARSDLYSLGVVMYEMLAGEAPFPQTERPALQHAVLGDTPPPIAERIPGLDPLFAALVMRCIARAPPARPESADDVVFQLERIAAGAPQMPEGNPYRGLAPFEAEQRAVFFGRGPEISAIVDRLRSEALVVVAGDSGIGKSSLCRAGVVPAVVAGALGGNRRWAARTIALGRAPLTALLDGLGLDALPELTEDGRLATLLGRRLAGPADRGLLLFIDQLEELVTQSPPRDAARTAALLAALGDGVPGVKILVAVRGDFLTRVAALPGLRGVMTRSLHLVRGLSPDDARDAVVSPARAKGVRFETEAMVDALVASIADRPAGLPLLQFALSELWVRRDLERAVIPATALVEIGGVAGALAGHADRVLTALAMPERSCARRILLGLVTAEHTRGSRIRAELVANDDPTTTTALEALVSGRLVIARDVADGEPVYELAHESMLSAWGTLRGWLDDAAGQRAVRTRLASAATEWRRLGRRRELLWSRPQLAEVAQLDDLAAGDRAFLRASRRAARLRIAHSVAITAAVPAAAGATWWGLAQREQARQEQEVDKHLADARRFLAQAGTLTADARRARAEAETAFQLGNDTVAEGWWLAPVVRLAAAMGGELQWSASVERYDRARTAYREAERALQVALQVGVRRATLRDAVAQTIYQEASLADELRDQPAVHDLEKRLSAYDDVDAAYLTRWEQPSPVTITATGASRIEIASYAQDPDGSWPLSDWHAHAGGAALDARLRPGSHLARITAPGIAPVYYPFLVERNHPLRLVVGLPRPGQVPPGFVYVPAGKFLTGSDDQAFYRQYFLQAQPLHAETTHAFLIGRHEVTYAEWIVYLRALPAAERALLLRDAPRGERTSRLKDGARFILEFQPFGEVYTAAEGKPLVYKHRTRHASVEWERSPAGSVSLYAAQGYTAWLARSGRVPGARLCTPREWERAARGADGREFPSGDDLTRVEEANIDETYDDPTADRTLTQGPDEVGSHPASNSPFGISDMSGNAYEWVFDGEVGTLRGGSWWFGRTTALLTNSSTTQAIRTDAYNGLRVCADG